MEILRYFHQLYQFIETGKNTQVSCLHTSSTTVTTNQIKVTVAIATSLAKVGLNLFTWV